MTELCRSLGHNITATDKDVIDTEFKLRGKSSNLSGVCGGVRNSTNVQADKPRHITLASLFYAFRYSGTSIQGTQRHTQDSQASPK